MYPDDRVLVGVINRRRDFEHARDRHWYRIPQERAPHGVYAEYIAFFLSGRTFREQSGGIHYYAARKGLELLRRRDLLPDEPDHKNADRVYYKVQLEPLQSRVPPIFNPTRRAISFIYTTWDRFVHAGEIGDLYSTADYYVDRIYHALRDSRVHPQRYWEAERRETGQAPQLRILCARGTVVASTEPAAGAILLDERLPDDAILAEIRARIAAMGGPITVNVPIE